jgi:5-methylcytosine-specific restriction endonuclease McrA
MPKYTPAEPIFPIWAPHYRTLSKIQSLDKKRGFASLRHSASAFIKRSIVRQLVMEKCKGQCMECNSTNYLQVDHIISVYLTFKTNTYLEILNTYENLQILCKYCNASKSPERINL